ncbi:LysR family transcriptional regulator [Burkholderia stabilis]|uniref:LysR family transcriptional regulator n=1 Tax=Burkholderia stabilis TaxID=95485 RepID=UPI00085178B4|nr:LysR family transcriptional regulator [Burkholderia stabilis]AOR72257.1 LysR family transcriptional regulator [Burkholderia stabilis]HDR9492143.1 LysR family transcriptional regulator [Burkholderia stabilis]HDR9522387.1 LysR family transcriptional regulator [Burkholderia stabilis]HDR9530241.1 LysR family transcriptional regulator [Burkholderia stabilis]HDR9539765.1 LysR family transcriptional regulator [Burkholderia stabilis]
MRSKLDLNAVRVFVSVVDEGSFAGAARVLSLPGSNVSRHVAQLEAKLGVRLLERSTRHVRMTEAGRLLHERARPMLDALMLAESELTSQQTELRGVLKLCVPGEIGPRMLGPIVAEFASRYPHVEIDCDTSLAGISTLRDDIDLSIIVNRGKLDDSAFIVRPLARLPSVVVAAPSLIARTGLPTRTEQLRQLPCITTLSTLKGQPWQFADSDGRIHKIPVASRYRVNSGEMAGLAALNGIGFAILVERACAAELADGRLLRVPLEMAPAPLELLAAYANRNSVNAKIRELVRMMQLRLETGEIVPSRGSFR